jgi:hypothetical protein
MRNHAPPNSPLAATVAVIIGCVLYLTVFYAAQPSQLASLPLLLLPDHLLWTWIGGDPGSMRLADRVPILGIVAIIHLTALASGWLTLHALRVDRMLTGGEIVIFSFGVGLNALSLLTLAIGLAGGLWQRSLFVAIIFALIGIAAWQIHRLRNAVTAHNESPSLPSAALPDSDADANRTGWLSLAALLPFAVVIVLGSMLPPWEFDVREYHLQVPKEWYQAGRVTFLPHNVYGNLPLGAEMHAVLAMVLMRGESDWWWGALAGKTVIGSFSLLTASLLWLAGRRFFSTASGAIAAMVYLSLPWIAHVSRAGLNEGAIGFYLLAAVYATLLWKVGNHHPSRMPFSRDAIAGTDSARGNPAHDDRWRLLVLAGFMAGAAAACKYTSLVFVILPLAACVAWPASLQDQSRSRHAWNGMRINGRPLSLFLIAALVGCGLWYGKNLVLAGNPTYPLLFGGRTRTPDKIAQWLRAHQVPTDAQGHRYSATQAADAVARIGWRSELLSPLLIPLALLAFLRRQQRREVYWLMGFTVWFIALWWLVTHRIDRFWVPLLPVLCLLAGAGATWSDSRIWRRTRRLLIACGLLANFLVIISPVRQDPSLGDDHRYLVSLDVLRRDEPAEPRGPSRVNPAHRLLNQRHQPGDRVLLVGDAQPFDLEMSNVYNTCFDDCHFEQWMRGRTRQQRLAAFREHGIRYVFFHWSDIRRYQSPGNYGFTDYVQRERIHDEFVREQNLLRPVSGDWDADFGELFEVVED